MQKTNSLKFGCIKECDSSKLLRFENYYCNIFLFYRSTPSVYPYQRIPLPNIRIALMPYLRCPLGFDDSELYKCSSINLNYFFAGLPTLCRPPTHPVCVWLQFSPQHACMFIFSSVIAIQPVIAI